MLEESVLTLAKNLQRPRTSQAAADDRGAAPARIAAAAAVDVDSPNLADSMSGSFSSILQEFAGLDLASADHSVGPRAAAMPAVPVSIPAPPAAALSSSGRSDSLLVHTLRLGERPALLAQRVTVGVAVQDVCMCVCMCDGRPAVYLGRRKLRGVVRPAAAGERREGRPAASGPHPAEDDHRYCIAP